jgi:hypothetical protein
LITAVDTSVLIDVFTNDPGHAVESLERLRSAAALGSLIACPIVWAEVRGSFLDSARMEAVLAAATIGFDPFDRDCAELAGAMWRDYRRSGGSRSRLAADFLIGAHAQVRGGRLLTRDRGFYRRYFAAVAVV